ncbi:MAG: sugar-transfer associated ATP-grasp domain-containing protein, partial [Candidatus Heimdallarchaeota archaeon]
MNTTIILLLMGIIGFVARLLMTDALIIIQNSLFLFRFMLAIVVILIAKYVLSVQSYGLYGPSVLVVAFLALGPFWGLLLFLNIFILLFAVRSLLSVFNLPVGFRIGILMVFTIAYLGLFELIGELFRISFLSNPVFMPIIITPWIADRYVIDVQQNDHYIAAKKLGATLLISLSAYLLMNNDALVLFVAVNPETWILLVAMLLYFGKYRQYTRFDFKRFDSLFASGDRPLSLLIRNREFITQYNSTVLYPLINKFNMKDQFDNWRVPTTELLGILSDEKDLDKFIDKINTDPRYENGFVIKPSQSFGGLGIIVVTKRIDTDIFRIGGESYHVNAIREECEKILQGDYLTSQTASDTDIILIEERIVCYSKLAKISIGLPDIRVIVFRGVPVMAMARLPTEQSGGKANLKQGAIGAAISIATGEITRAEWKK